MFTWNDNLCALDNDCTPLKAHIQVSMTTSICPAEVSLRNILNLNQLQHCCWQLTLTSDLSLEDPFQRSGVSQKIL